MTDAVSVVIPNLHSPVIHRVLAALHDQSWYPAAFEVIVVGLDRYGLVTEDASVRFLRTDGPASPARARNLGWRAARHDAVVFLDADCVPRPDWLHNLISFADQMENVGAVSCGMDCESRSFWTTCDQVAAFHEHSLLNPSGERRNLPSYGIYVPRIVLQQTGGFDEAFRFAAGEDLDLTSRIKLLGYKLYFNPKAVVIHFPTRGTARDLWRHAYRSGHESIKVRLRYRNLYHMPFWSDSVWAWRLLALPIAWTKTAQILLCSGVFRHVHCAPAVFLAKVGWCLGAADSLSEIHTRD
jgi:GT2 family glycosyltransferase